jgi:hypothetical protein
MQLFVILSLLLLTSIRAQQNQCFCTCCNGPLCIPISLPTIDVQNCTLESCLGQCRTSYSQCQGNGIIGHVSAECASTVTPQFDCRCDCCNTGSTSCSPSYVGNTRVYSCQAGACSIACIRQYPNQCRADQSGLTQGTCTDYITTTTTSVGPWLGNICSCTCCQTGSCSPTSVGVTSASYCSSSICTQSCRNQYPLSCLSSLNLSQTNGTCISNIGGNTFCGCRCCGTNGCIDYKINTNGGCTTCDSMCRQYTPCTNTNQVTTQTCTTNNAKTSHPWIIFILMTSISTF